MEFTKSKRTIDYIPADPDKAIREVWKAIHLDTVLDEMEYWLYMAMANHLAIYENTEERANFVVFYFELLFFIEAIYFYDKLRDEEGKKRYEASTEEGKEFLDNINQRSRLTEDATLNPNPLIEEFCGMFPIAYARIELWDFFQAVNSYEGHFKSFINTEYSSQLYLNLLTLAEAAHILFPNDENKVDAKIVED